MGVSAYPRKEAQGRVLTPFHHPGRQAAFPVLGRVPGPDGIIIRFGAGAPAETNHDQSKQQEQEPARVEGKLSHEAGWAGITRSPSKISPICQPGKTLATERSFCTLLTLTLATSLPSRLM